MESGRSEDNASAFPPEGLRESPPEAAPESDERFGKLNWALFAAGFFAMCAGYAFLALASRRVEDALFRFSTWSPILIVAGLILFGAGFMPRRK